MKSTFHFLLIATKPSSGMLFPLAHRGNIESMFFQQTCCATLLRSLGSHLGARVQFERHSAVPIY